MGTPGEMVSPDRYIEVRYEDLVTELRATLEQICEFLELRYDSAMLDYPNDTTYSTPSPSSIGQWRRKLTPNAIRLAEAHIGEKLTELGYELSGHEPMPITPARQKIFSPGLSVSPHVPPELAVNLACRCRLRDSPVRPALLSRLDSKPNEQTRKAISEIKAY